MGVDYIRAQTGKPWKKRWDGGLNLLKQPSLLDLNMSEAARTVTADLEPGAKVAIGDTVIVQQCAGRLTISDGLYAIGVISNPSAELSAGVAKGGGYAEATLQRIGLFGDTAEVSIR